ncbi:MAG TPA: hypothetical protein VL173_14970 [Vicinamibacterales bacterium]|jgi:hypothetical protein|nr:hypothetical protein [Vicinamibacterales bacterium]
MAHPLVLGLFGDAASAAAAARALRTLGLPPHRVSIVARSHDAEGELADAAGASPGSELEDSRAASRLGELSAHLLAAVALALPGIGPIVADGPLAAGLGEAAGHMAGGLARTLERAGLTSSEASLWQTRIEGGAILVGAHVAREHASSAADALRTNGATVIREGTWP